MTGIWLMEWFKAMADERRTQPPPAGDLPDDLPDDDGSGRRSTEDEDDGTIEPFALRWRKRKEEPGQ
jgi:hypothetical protein